MPSPLRHDAFRAALLATACIALPAYAGIFKCTAADGSVSYQELACPASDSARTLDVPVQYPQVDNTARDRLFAREAELDRRLEAQRERDSREAVARAMQPPVQPIPAADEPVGYPVYLGPPLLQRNPHNPRHPQRHLHPRVNPLDRRG
jgi:uncharacterized protein DUF4124